MSAVFFLNDRAQVLLARNFRGDVPLSCMDNFAKLIDENPTPCFVSNGVNYMYVRHADLIVCCVSSSAETNALATLHFLTQAVKSFEKFVKTAAVESVTDNFVVLYELLDEMMDFGYVQTTDSNLLEEYVTQTSYALETSQAVATLTDAISWRPPGIFYKKNELFVDVVETVNMQITLNSAVSGKPAPTSASTAAPIAKSGSRARAGINDGPRPSSPNTQSGTTVPSSSESTGSSRNSMESSISRTNSIASVGSSKSTLKSAPSTSSLSLHSSPTPHSHRINTEIVGKLSVKSFLSGMPKLTLGLNARDSVAGLSFHRASRYVVLKDIGFHECVELENYERTKTIEFVPPDGSFDLLQYRCDPPLLALFDVNPSIVLKPGSRVIIKCSVKAVYKKRQQCRVAEFRFPVPEDCGSPRWKASMGRVVYVPESKLVVWRIPDFKGQMEASVHAELSLPVGDIDQDVRPIEARFEMPGAALSGLQIRHLKIDEPNLQYKALPWVRYLSKSGNVEVRFRTDQKLIGNE